MPAGLWGKWRECDRTVLWPTTTLPRRLQMCSGYFRELRRPSSGIRLETEGAGSRKLLKADATPGSESYTVLKIHGSERYTVVNGSSRSKRAAFPAPGT